MYQDRGRLRPVYALSWLPYSMSRLYLEVYTSLPGHGNARIRARRYSCSHLLRCLMSSVAVTLYTCSMLPLLSLCPLVPLSLLPPFSLSARFRFLTQQPCPEQVNHLGDSTLILRLTRSALQNHHYNSQILQNLLFFITAQLLCQLEMGIVPQLAA